MTTNWPDRHAEDFRIYRAIMGIAADEPVGFGVLFSNWTDSTFARNFLFACIGQAAMTKEQVLAALSIYRASWIEYLPNLMVLGERYAELYQQGTILRNQEPLDWIAIRHHRQQEWEIMQEAESGAWRGAVQA